MGNPRIESEQSRRISFYATPDHDCAYLEGRRAVTLFADPYARLDTGIYNKLIQYGFRRSGRHIYRPACPSCSACVPVRLSAGRFRPNRSQRRCAARNADLTTHIRPAAFDPEHHALYLRYVGKRHAGGGMDVPEPEKYMEFLVADWCETRFVELRLDQRLVAVAVVDVLDTGLSAVYTFFDPDLPRRSLGTAAILEQLRLCRQWGLDWLYLGYWIESCEKMRYKTGFRPLQFFRDGSWLDFPHGD